MLHFLKQISLQNFRKACQYQDYSNQVGHLTKEELVLRFRVFFDDIGACILKNQMMSPGVTHINLKNQSKSFVLLLKLVILSNL